MSENLAEEYADTLVRSLTELWDAMDSDPDSEYDGYESPYEALMAMPLEITREVGEPFRILLTFGGPNAWITSNAHGEWAKSSPPRSSAPISTTCMEAWRGSDPLDTAGRSAVWPSPMIQTRTNRRASFRRRSCDDDGLRRVGRHR